MRQERNNAYKTLTDNQKNWWRNVWQNTWWNLWRDIRWIKKTKENKKIKENKNIKNNKEKK